MDGTYSQALIAGIEALFPGGRHFNLLETSTAVDLVFYDQNNRIIAKADQVQAGLEYSPKDEKGRPVRFINVGITSALAQTVKIYVTDGDFVYRRSIGDVDAKIFGDGLYQDLSNIGLLKQADTSMFYDVLNTKDEFILGVSKTGSSNKAEVMLHNPQGSGVIAIIKRLTIIKAAAEELKLVYNTALGGVAHGDATAFGLNKYLGETVALCEGRNRNSSTPVAGTSLMRSTVLSGLPFIMDFNPALILPADAEIILQDVTNNSALLYGIFEWKEI